MVHAGCVFVAGIHLSRTWMSGSFESVRWNACVHRLDLSLHSHPNEFLGNGVRTHVDSKGKIPCIGGLEEGQTRDAASRKIPCIGSLEESQIGNTASRKIHCIGSLEEGQTCDAGSRKIPCSGSLDEGQAHDTVSCKPSTLPTELLRPQLGGSTSK